MKIRKIGYILGCLFFVTLFAYSQENKVVWIVLDGVRWQEVFGGADSLLLHSKKFVYDINGMNRRYWRATKEERREALMPFIWDFAVKNGMLIGNRWKGAKMNVTNGMHFSYPGYSEMLCGFADDERINSNKKFGNPNESLLEVMNRLPDFEGKVLAFSSWDVFPYILNVERSKLPVNAGHMHSLRKEPTERERFLDILQDEMPRRWGGFRYDAFTYHYALEAMKKDFPRLIFINFLETDIFPHDGRYDHYLFSIHNSDRLIRELWEYCQSEPFYKDQTTFIVTVDHGRGNNSSDLEQWRHHSNTIPGCDETLILFFGNGVKPLGEVTGDKQYYNNQIAATVAGIFNIVYRPEEKKIGDPFPLK